VRIIWPGMHPVVLDNQLLFNTLTHTHTVVVRVLDAQETHGKLSMHLHQAELLLVRFLFNQAALDASLHAVKVDVVKVLRTTFFILIVPPDALSTYLALVLGSAPLHSVLVDLQ